MRKLIALIIGCGLVITSCSASHLGDHSAPASTLNAPTEASTPAESAPIKIVATTAIVADMARHVAGERAEVINLIPASADLHSFEPTLRTIREVAYSDLLLANGLLLEPQALLSVLHNSSRPGTPVVAVGEEISQHGAELIPLVENVALDAVWLGFRVDGDPDLLAPPAVLEVSQISGPGTVTAFITGTFGTPEVLFRGPGSIELPQGAHTHVSWAFSDPGVYEMVVNGTPVHIAVGVDPHGALTPPREVVDRGHIDIVASTDAAEGVHLLHEGVALDPNEVIIAVPNNTWQPIPSDPAFRFLGRPGQETYLLPQAVLGRHVHGEVDPHIWHDVDNAIAMVKVIRDHLLALDPAGASEYEANTLLYVRQLVQLNIFLRQRYDTIPIEHRHLVSTHHGFAYLARAYGLSIGGFVTPNPAIEPSARDLVALSRTLENLNVPAVFIDKHAAGYNAALSQTAEGLGISVCPILSENFDRHASSYVELMVDNAEQLTRCLK